MTPTPSPQAIRRLLTDYQISAQAPCRVDMGGTLDIPLFSILLQSQRPCTVNLAVTLQNRVILKGFDPGWIQVHAPVCPPLTLRRSEITLDHPLGFVLGALALFELDGIRVELSTDAPVRSGLGGSSATLVALLKACDTLMAHAPDTAQTWSADHLSCVAHQVEQAAAGVGCGYQDYLAAAYGGCHAWHWQPLRAPYPFRAEALMSANQLAAMPAHFLLAYTGEPHSSFDINRRWMDQFRQGGVRGIWAHIADLTHEFRQALRQADFQAAGRCMLAEVRLRRELTPDILNPVGERLLAAAAACGCGARFTGAGGGGCLYALGDAPGIQALHREWAPILAERPEACLLPCRVDGVGAQAEIQPC